VLFAVALFVCAFLAPSYRGPALKFALRGLSGILLFFAARSLVSPEQVARVVTAIVLGALVSAGLAAVDSAFPASAAFFRYFREGAFETVGLRRASGVFGYPTIGAMYWEAAVPLVVAFPIIARRKERGPRAWKWELVGVLLATAILAVALTASGTRSGIAGAGIACIAMIGLAGRSPRTLRPLAGAALGVLLTLSIGMAGVGTRLGHRLLFWQDHLWLRAEYQVGETPPSVRAGATLATPLTLTNTGVLAWRRTSPGAVHVSYHWECESGGFRSDSDREGTRTELPADVPPGGSIEVVVEARAPDAPGRYRLVWDLVQENVSWFSELGNQAPWRRIAVAPGDDSRAFDAGGALATCLRLVKSPDPPSRAELWRAALALFRRRPLLGVGPDNFRRRYEDILVSPEGLRYEDQRIHANSLFFETLADEGLLGMGALAWLAFALLCRLRHSTRLGLVAGVATGVASGAFFVHGAFDYFFEFTPLFGLFWLLLGLVATSTPDGERQDSRR
jgi:hypothetical protein